MGVNEVLRRLAAAVAILLFSCGCLAQGVGAAKMEPPRNAPVTAAPTSQKASDATPAPPPGEALIAKRLDAIDAKLAEPKAKPPDYVPAFITFASGLIGAVLGAFIALMTQRRALAAQTQLTERSADHAKQLADAKSKLEIRNSFAQWQLKQLSDLYGPLHALLRQSNALYRLMNEALEKSAGAKFRIVQGEPNDDFDGKVFQIHINGDWERFRTVMHIGQVYGEGYGIEAYFDELVAIGGRMARVIEEKAGFTRDDQKALIPLFGRYLAHYQVLLHLQRLAKARIEAKAKGEKVADMTVDSAAVFPQEIQRIVFDGYERLVDELNDWRALAE